MAAAGFTLLETTIAPGFDPEDYEAGQRPGPAKKYLSGKALIVKLTPESR